ncbi:hypothetical protein ACVW00_001686 [Marmoricola sp. URHA0025 HA25]
MPVRIPVAVVALVLGVTCGVVALATLSSTSGAPSAPARPRTAVTAAAERSAVGVLHAWDERRAAAWAGGDPAALARLYTTGSAAGLADVRLLGRYAGRGLLVPDLRMQLLRARVLVARPRRLELEVTDRVALATAVRADDHTVARRLPTDAPTTRRLVLRREHGRWLMDSVSVRVPSGGR